MKAFAKSAEPINIASEVGNIFRRAFTKLKNGRGGPVIVEIPVERGSAGTAGLHAGAAHAVRRRSRACEASGGAVGRRQAAGDLCRPGRALRTSLAPAQAARRTARHP